MADPSLLRSAFSNGKTTPASGKQPGIPKLRPIGEANKPPPDEPGDEDDDLFHGMDDEGMPGDMGAEHPVDLDAMGKEWPDVEEAVEDIAKAHKAGDMEAMTEAVNRLTDAFAGHGISGKLEVDEDAMDDDESDDDSDDKDDADDVDDDKDGDDEDSGDDSEDDESDDDGADSDDSDDAGSDPDDEADGDDDESDDEEAADKEEDDDEDEEKKPKGKKGNPFAKKGK